MGAALGKLAGTVSPRNTSERWGSGMSHPAALESISAAHELLRMLSCESQLLAEKNGTGLWLISSAVIPINHLQTAKYIYWQVVKIKTFSY